MQQRTRMCLLSKVLSCCLPCRHVVCEVIIIRLPGSHGGAWHRVEVCASGNNYNVHCELWTIRKYMSKLLIPYHWSPWLGDTLLQFENWTKDLFACIAKWKIALKQPHAFCVWSGVDTLGSVVGGYGHSTAISHLVMVIVAEMWHSLSTFLAAKAAL